MYVFVFLWLIVAIGGCLSSEVIGEVEFNTYPNCTIETLKFDNGDYYAKKLECLSECPFCHRTRKVQFCGKDSYLCSFISQWHCRFMAIAAAFLIVAIPYLIYFKCCIGKSDEDDDKSNSDSKSDESESVTSNKDAVDQNDKFEERKDKSNSEDSNSKSDDYLPSDESIKQHSKD